MTLVDALNFHATQNSGPMVWGKSDCCTFVRNIILAAFDVDILAGIPTFKTEKQAISYFKYRGGVLRMAMRQAKKLELEELEFPIQGNPPCVGVVAGQFGPTLAVRVMGLWFCRAEKGVTQMQPDSAVIAWGLKCPQQ